MASNKEIELKIVIVGDGGCGKSALLMSYTQKKYPPDKATVVDNYEVLLSIGQGQNLKLTVVDTAGQEDFVNIRKLSYGGTHTAIICYSCISKASLANVDQIWHPELTTAQQMKKPHFVLVGNKIDATQPGSPDTVTRQAGEALCKKLGGFAHLQCSAKRFSETEGAEGNCEEVFKVAIKCGLDSIGYFDQEDCCGKCTIL